MVRITFVFFFSCLFSVAYSQSVHDYFCENQNIDSTHQSKFGFHIYDVAFFKNNEYFDEYVEGYTLIGNAIRPGIYYQFSNKFFGEIGFTGVQYSGREKFSIFQPFVRFQYAITKNLNCVFGNIYGNVHHKIPDPILDNELYFYKNTESGLQFLYNSDYFQSDLWLNWEQFILPTDKFQEKFTAGWSTVIKNKNKKNSLFVPIQMLTTHRGGQINNGNEHLQSISHWGIGLGYDKEINKPYLKKLNFRQMAYSYNDISPYKAMNFTMGRSFFTSIVAQNSFMTIDANYWFSDSFVSTRGEEIYSYRPEDFPRKYMTRYRSLGVVKVQFQKQIKDLKLAFRTEIYYDFFTSTTEYNYLLSLIWDSKFQIKSYE